MLHQSPLYLATLHSYGGNLNIPYREWIDIAICKAVSMGAVVLLDNHLWVS
jgi:hypothetical protein